MVVTSYAAPDEPRGPRHAVAARMAFPDAEIVFVDMPAMGDDRPEPPLLAEGKIARRRLPVPTRAAAPVQLAWRKGIAAAARLAAQRIGRITPAAFGARVVGLTQALTALRADLYIAHNADTFLAAAHAAEATGAALALDCMEFHADMGDAQTALEAAITEQVEEIHLPRCGLVIAASAPLADALAARYGVPRPLPALNAPPVLATLPPKRNRKPGKTLTLYWRNSTIGFGQRGLDDILTALRQTPPEIRLVLQGRPAMDGGAAVRARIEALGLSGRVEILAPFAAGQAVAEAAVFDVGLCLERRGPRNHELTISNKMFDYHMAGLAVITTDLPPLRGVVEASEGGIVAPPSDPPALAAAASRLYQDRALLEALQRNARAYALREANHEAETRKVAEALAAAFGGARVGET